MARPTGKSAALVPEFDVRDLDTSLRFYVDVIGFAVIFERPAERFAYLGLHGAELMLQDASGPGRRFRTAPLEPPFGRGVNVQIAVTDVDAVSDAVHAVGIAPVVDLEERWYDVDVVTPSGRWNKRGSM